VHLDHDNCLEVIVARGAPERLEDLAKRLKSTKGVKYCTLSAASTGSKL
jgi:CopG family nickel-responsive transcriptional regulator